MTGTRPGPRSSELRLALAMRGGVSLAVWMGGACCETSRLRDASPESPVVPGTAVYRKLLEGCQYRSVDIDVLAGTSAGGLNGVLLACNLVYGMPFGAGVRDVWLRLGDLEDLLRRPALGGLETLLRRRTLFVLPDSLMRGDEFFYEELRAAMEKLMGEAPRGFKASTSLRLILTATRLRPRNDRVRPTLGQPLLVGRSDAYFHFRHRGGLTDFPTDVEARKEALKRLAYAARTSSSFPGAFEPGRLFVGNEPPWPPEDPPRVDMRGISSETGYPDERLNGCAEFIDGGLLDNIPVAWAVRAIAGTPVTRKADRWLLFLQPVPPFPPEPVKGAGPGATRLVRIAAKSLAVKSGAESLYDDALALRAASDTTQLTRGITRALPPDLASLRCAAAAREASYSAAVGLAEAKRLIRLLEDPSGVTGPDSLPVPAGPGPLEVLDTGRGEASVFFARLREEAENLAPTPRGTPLALARAVRLLMDWVSACEEGRGEDGNDGRYDDQSEGRHDDQNDGRNEARLRAVAECRELLYAYRFAVSTLIAVWDRLLLDAYAAGLAGGVPADPLAPRTRAAERLRAALAVPSMPAELPSIPATGALVQRWRTWAVDLAAALADGPQPPPGAGAVDHQVAYADLWDRIAELGRYIGRRLDPAPVGFGALGAAALLGNARMLGALTDAEILLGPMRPDPQSEATDIDFHTVSAANRSWAADLVLGRERTPREMVEGKLSGNQVANFAAFLSVRWRLGDWIWGRLDTAASLVSVVATDERLERAFGGFTDLPDLHLRVARLMDPGPRFTELWDQSLENRAELEPWDRVRYVLTAVRQREILGEELPLLTELHRKGFKAGNRVRDIPDPQLVPELDLDAPGALGKALEALGEVGAERAGRLLRAPDPCRAAVRTGLVAWSSLQPSGRSWARLPRAVLAALKPVFCLLPVIAWFAPRKALVAAALMGCGVAVGAGHWSSLLGQVPVWLAVGALFALAAAALLRAGCDRYGPVCGFAVGAGLLAGGLQYGNPGPTGWWGALILYAVLLWVTAVLPWLYPKPRTRPAPPEPDTAPGR
ncbi:DUF3376 domain-containing protein [Streptomyces sp. NBC_00435]|uniref:DUF3376 domain-containing protein n=1 Tax=Streptomyces sp. NBC_00435 TaxID=2903649 RepID=UPI002E1B2853